MKPDPVDPVAIQEALAELSSDILAEIGRDGRVIRINRAVESLLGYRREAILDQDILDLAPPEEQISLLARLRDPLPDSEPFPMRFRATSGHWISFEVLMRPRPGGKPRDGALFRARTVAAEEKYRELFEESRDAIVIGTLEGRIVDINPAGVRLFGFASKEEMLELDIAQDLYWNPEDRERTGALFRSQGYMQDTEIELRTKEGQKIRVVESASAMRDPRGNLTGFRGILRDVTDYHRLQDQLRQSQKMEAVGRLAGGVAHDFNNLLTAINGYSELLLARLEAGDSKRTALEEIRRAGKRATELTRRLLTLSRHQVVSPRSLNLNRTVLDMEKLLQRVLGADIQLRTRLAAKLPDVFADQSQMEQVILNLAVNARDAMPDGGVLELQTRAIHDPEDLPAQDPPLSGERVLLQIQDTGRGMETGVREKAFEPFFTTKEEGHNAGLGLSIVYGIVAQADGIIEVDSNPGKGTTFRLFFPVDSPRETPHRLSEDRPEGTERILVVEDEAAVRTLVRQILEIHGYSVQTAENPSDALRTLDKMDESSRPELLLTDVVMPGRGGLYLAGEMQQRDKNLKVLFMSGYTEQHGDIRRVVRRGSPLLSKPFSPGELARKVREILDT